MRAVIFGATGMVGQGALQECLRDGDVDRVVSIVRAPSGKQHYCLGVTSTGITEEA